MDDKDQNDSASKKSAVNIDINGDPNEGGVKSMNLDAGNERRAGLTKEELMKYADQPFWVRLRSTLFAAFWIIWLSILAAAILYVVKSPNCVAVVSAMASNATTATSPSSSGE